MAKNDSLPPPTSLAWMHAIDRQPAARSKPGTTGDPTLQKRAGSARSDMHEGPAAGSQADARPSAAPASAGPADPGGKRQAAASVAARLPELAPATGAETVSVDRPTGLRGWLNWLVGASMGSPGAERTPRRKRPPPRIIFGIALLALGGAGVLGYVLTGGADGPIARFFITDDSPVTEPRDVLPTAAP